MSYKNGYGLNEYLIDGGIISNNPSLYAYQIASILNKNTPFRMLNLGTGVKNYKPLKKNIDWKAYY